jgi:hypothetical protein
MVQAAVMLAAAQRVPFTGRAGLEELLLLMVRVQAVGDLVLTE